MKAPEWIKRNANGLLDIPRNAENVYGVGHLIRVTEESILKLFSEGRVCGTIHTALGQEICQLGFVRCLKDPDDAIFSNHRNHGHFLAYCGDVEGLVGEVMGKQLGVCRGKGGSQHIGYKNFHSSGIQGGLTGIAVGMAKARQMLGGKGVVAVFIGDGTLGEGLVYESMNLAAVWKVPVLFVVENNRIAQTTETADALGGSIEARGRAFGLTTWVLTDRSPAFLEEAEAVVDEVRRNRRPGFCVVNTSRMGPHSKGDDFRPETEKLEIQRNDPLARWGAELSGDIRGRIEAANLEYINAVVKSVAASADAAAPDKEESACPAMRSASSSEPLPEREPVSVGASLNAALAELLKKYPEVVLVGEDLHDPYGGAFKVAKGLSTAYPKRVISTPISEAGIVGAAIGMAMYGMKPVVEIMFADFLTLCLDQIYNHAVKFPWLFGCNDLSMVVRSPSGGHRGYGPTHSQSLEHLYVAVPGLTVVYPSHRHDGGQLLKSAVLRWGRPVAFFEHKLAYKETQLRSGYEVLPADEDGPGAALFPTLVRNVPDADITIVTYGGSLAVVEEVVKHFEQEELQVEVVVPSLLSPLPGGALARRLLRSKKLFIVEEAPKAYGVGAELLAQLLERNYRGNVVRIGAPPVPIPAARALECDVLPVKEEIIAMIMQNLQ